MWRVGEGLPLMVRLRSKRVGPGDMLGLARVRVDASRDRGEVSSMVSQGNVGCPIPSENLQLG